MKQYGGIVILALCLLLILTACNREEQIPTAQGSVPTTAETVTEATESASFGGGPAALDPTTEPTAAQGTQPPATSGKEEKPAETTKPTEPEETTAPTELEETTAPTEPEETTRPTEPEETTAPTEPEETTKPTDPTETTGPGSLSSDAAGYGAYMAMSPQEQQAYFETFDSVQAFFAWYNAAKAAYEAENPDIEIGGDGNVDLGGK